MALASLALVASAQSSTVLVIPTCADLELLVASSTQLAKSGCCSHHGGVCGCNSKAHRQICCDGALSPSCGC
jgi:hypothetical protein